MKSDEGAVLHQNNQHQNFQISFIFSISHGDVFGNIHQKNLEEIMFGYVQ
jgi:hypothetical protein